MSGNIMNCAERANNSIAFRFGKHELQAFERDVYRLIMRSKLPSAEAFEEKVVSEVLPAIRKTGGYIVAAPEETPDQLVLRAMTVLQATVERQKEQLADALPKVAAYARLAPYSGSLSASTPFWANTLMASEREGITFCLRRH